MCSQEIFVPLQYIYTDSNMFLHQKKKSKNQSVLVLLLKSYHLYSFGS